MKKEVNFYFYFYLEKLDCDQKEKIFIKIHQVNITAYLISITSNAKKLLFT
jgi:hypothetical protein